MQEEKTGIGRPDNSGRHDGRPSVDEYGMLFAVVASTRSTCLRRKVGAVLMKNKRVLSTGYNGSPKGLPHCLTEGCLRDELMVESGTRHEICRAVHAEKNAINQCAEGGPPCKGATMYATISPCKICAKDVINAGIERIVYRGDYSDLEGVGYLRQANVKVERLKESKEFRSILSSISELLQQHRHQQR